MTQTRSTDSRYPTFNRPSVGEYCPDAAAIFQVGHMEQGGWYGDVRTHMCSYVFVLNYVTEVECSGSDL